MSAQGGKFRLATTPVLVLTLKRISDFHILAVQPQHDVQHTQVPLGHDAGFGFDTQKNL
jgi:hypothetical protein